MNQIKNRWNGKVICEGEESIKELVKKNRADLSGANLSRADLSRADLSRANLSWADLSWADLSRADLSWADLSWANLSRADLSGADLSGADLSWANLSRADLSWADLSGANLSRADLSWANLSRADLSRAKNIEFWQFPSIRLISSIQLNNLPDNLQLELMRRDAFAHPHPEKFDEWGQGGGCPYDDVERFWLFEPKRELWSPGLPQMADRDLIKELVKSQGWKIKGYLQ